MQILKVPKRFAPKNCLSGACVICVGYLVLTFTKSRTVSPVIHDQHTGPRPRAYISIGNFSSWFHHLVQQSMWHWRHANDGREVHMERYGPHGTLRCTCNLRCSAGVLSCTYHVKAVTRQQSHFLGGRVSLRRRCCGGGTAARRSLGVEVARRATAARACCHPWAKARASAEDMALSAPLSAGEISCMCSNQSHMIFEKFDVVSYIRAYSVLSGLHAQQTAIPYHC